MIWRAWCLEDLVAGLVLLTVCVLEVSAEVGLTCVASIRA